MSTQHTPGPKPREVYTIKRAYTMRDGRDVPAGWDVFVNGNWGNRYALKRDARAAIAKATGAAS